MDQRFGLNICHVVSFSCIRDQFPHFLYQLPFYNLIVEYVLGKTKSASMVDRATNTLCMVVTLVRRSIAVHFN